MSQLYPVFLKLEGKTVLIVGGGRLAVQKLRTLRETGARAVVIAPRLRPALWCAIPGVQVTLVHRAWRRADLAGAGLVFAATGDAALNHRIVHLARRAGIPANAVDDPAHCDFYTPSVLRRGAVTLALSTGGKFPGVSKALRETLEAWLPPRDDGLVEGMLAMRRAIQASGRSAAGRTLALRDLLRRFKAEYLDPEAPGGRPERGVGGGRGIQADQPADRRAAPNPVS